LGGLILLEEIEFSSHSLLKIEILRSHNFDLSKEIIEDIVRFPDKIDAGYQDRLIAQKAFDETHVLRVVYEKKTEKLLVITVYPGRRSRYEKY
jgi:5,10-methylenetetrahydrofolate reductase